MARPARFMIVLCIGAALAACTRVPEIEDKLTPDLRDADYPTLLPLDDALPAQTSPAEAGAELDTELKARAARLKARAAALNSVEL